MDATDLLVLGAASKTASLQPFRISQDASRITSEGESTNWDPVELTVLLGSQAAIVIGRNGQTYRDEGNQWAPYLDTWCPPSPTPVRRTLLCAARASRS